MKRSALKPGKPLAPGKGLAKGKGIKSKPPKIAPEVKKFRKQYLEDHPHCEVGRIAGTLWNTGCTYRATGLHERQKRSALGSLSDPNNVLSSCGTCNTWVEDNPMKARGAGLVVYAHEDPNEVPVVMIHG